jgi:hypothetical protein
VGKTRLFRNQFSDGLAMSNKRHSSSEYNLEGRFSRLQRYFFKPSVGSFFFQFMKIASKQRVWTLEQLPSHQITIHNQTFRSQQSECSIKTQLAETTNPWSGYKTYLLS